MSPTHSCTTSRIPHHARDARGAEALFAGGAHVIDVQIKNESPRAISTLNPLPDSLKHYLTSYSCAPRCEPGAMAAQAPVGGDRAGQGDAGRGHCDRLPVIAAGETIMARESVKASKRRAAVSRRERMPGILDLRRRCRRRGRVLLHRGRRRGRSLPPQSWPCRRGGDHHAGVCRLPHGARPARDTVRGRVQAVVARRAPATPGSR